MPRSSRFASGVFVAILMSFSPSIVERAQAEPVTTIRNNGSPANRVDLVVVGDGYTAGELGKFAADAETAVQGFFADEAFSEYRNYFNVHRVDAISNQSGADHPHLNIFKDTALDASYDCAGIQRLICVNLTKVNTVVTASLPAGGRDMILVLVNDPEYGGSGGAVAVASTHIDAVEIVLHEVGHSLGQLADEYGGPPPPTCVLSEPPQANATAVTDRAQIKWKHWIDASTPIPTTVPSIGLPGLYQGANYCDAGVYRPTDQSKMRFLYRPFEQINNEQLIKRIYSFVSPLDSAQPAIGSMSLWQGGTVQFGVGTPVPFTHALNVGWTIDGGAPVGTGSVLNIDVGALGIGSHVLDALISDPTSMVRSDPLQLLNEHRSWTVNVFPMPTLAVTPNTGVGTTATFSAAFTDAVGVANLAQVYLRISTTPSASTNICMVRYDKPTGSLSLRDDASNWLPGVVLPSGGTLQNSQCSIALGASAVSTADDTLTLTVAVSFSGAYTGTKNVYLYATSVLGGATGWQLRGVWDVLHSISAVSVSPSSGTGVTQAFTLQYSDGAGGGDLSSARVRFAATNVGPGTCTAWYNAVADTISILDDGGSAWTSGTLGSGSLANSQCTLNLASSSRTINGHNLTLVLDVTFKPSFTGLKNIYMLAQSNSGPNTGWLLKGTWTPATGGGPAIVNAVSVSPNAGSGATQTFTLQYSDSLGANDLSSARVRFGASNVGPGTCTAWYDATIAMIKLMDDGGSWGAAVSLGSGTLSNSQCTLNLASSTATPNGTNLSVVLSVTFNASFTGLKNIYLLAGSNTVPDPSTGWVQRGTWTPNPVVGPAVVNAVSVTPNSGTGLTQAFTLTYSDSLGAGDLSSARVRIGAANIGPGTCTAWYDATIAMIKLMDDGGVWGSPVSLGSGTLSNSQCTLNLASSTATPNGNNLTLVLNITFDGSFTGLKNIYMLAAGNTAPNPSTGWLQKGTWTPSAGGGPAVVDAISVSPNTGSGASQTFTLQYSDSFGATDLSSARVRFGATNVAPGTCSAWYDATTGTIKLMDDAGVWGSPAALGSGTLSNSQCTLDLASSGANINGTDLALTLVLSFSSSFDGLKNIYLLASSATGPNSGWLLRGTFTVNTSGVSGSSALDPRALVPLR